MRKCLIGQVEDFDLCIRMPLTPMLYKMVSQTTGNRVVLSDTTINTQKNRHTLSLAPAGFTGPNDHWPDAKLLGRQPPLLHCSLCTCGRRRAQPADAGSK